ncbi:MAG: lipid IV(A) 3-deoxy-D-manno-octulosonic acid transferase [Gammaproteobacteria bacterium]|nr:lipid IV(A) 3-deoxy-D-manno-octulosonic acid transferase [Gammaproteobacteria bacterium]
MRLLYNLLTYLMLIPYACYWIFRSLSNPPNLKHLGQRFGFGFPRVENCIWLHAVSVGEVQAAVPLIKLLMEKYPGRQLLITTVTNTGKQRVEAIFGDAVLHSYIPFEFPHAVRSFFRSANPSTALIMETEIWPNLYRGCGIRNIPLILVSARVSPRSLPGYRKLLPLIRETLSHGIIIAAQSKADADRFLALGASPERTRVTGNIKFDVDLHPEIIEAGRALRADLIGDRPVWIAASTHEGEEQPVLVAHRRLLEKFPDLLLILVPRHPERFAEVRALIEKSGLAVVSRTDNISVPAATPVLLGDTMGELPLFYAASDITFVGGSLVPVGGHNLLEPAAQSLPIITGPHLFNAQDMADMFAGAAASRVVRDSDELAAALTELLTNSSSARRLGDNARALLTENRGALQRLFVLLEPLLA